MKDIKNIFKIVLCKLY